MQPGELSGKVFIVTGGNTGIGAAIVHQLAQRSGHVALVSRNREKGEAAVQSLRAVVPDNAVDLVIGDLSTVAAVGDLAATLLERYPRIDVLINNAGVWPMQRVLNADGLETAFMVNHMAPFLLTTHLLQRITDDVPGRIVNVNAGLYVNGKLDMERTPYGLDFSRIRTYADSKLCNMLFTLELARRIDGTGVTVNAVHPGVIRTELGIPGGPLGWILRQVKRSWGTPEEGAKAPVWLATAPELAQTSGHYFNLQADTAVTAAAGDPELARRLWDLSTDLAALPSDPVPIPSLSVTTPA